MSSREASMKEMTSTDGPADPHRLSSQAIFFAKQPTPMLLIANATVVLIARAVVGLHPAYQGFTWVDLAVAGGAVGVWPLQEWVLHRYLLHMKPRKIFGFTFDPMFSKAHRSHHRQPWLVKKTLLPTQLILLLIPAQALWLLPFDRLGLALSAWAAYATMAVLYEWTHYLTHAAYAPKGRYYRRIWRNHRLHHFKNEKAWFAFTSPHIDAILGTDPKLSEVATSPTVRTLGVDDPPDEPLEAPA